MVFSINIIKVATVPALLGTWQPVLELAGGGILSLPNGTLIIEEVSLTDEGLYSCNVENGVGQPLSKTVWMSVNSEYYIIIITILRRISICSAPRDAVWGTFFNVNRSILVCI